MTLAEQFAEKAVEWARAEVPYEHRGTTRNGCDCTGILVGIARELGFLKNYKLRKYSPQWNLHAGAGDQVIEELSKFGHEVPKDQVSPGDVAIMLFGKCPAHCGVIISDDMMMVHSLKSNRRCTFGRLKKSMWSGRWKKTFRLDENKLRQYS